MPQVVRSPLRFARKFYAAQLLQARMFGGEEAVADLTREIQNTALWQENDTKLHEIMGLSTPHLQQFVRAKCTMDPSATDRYKVFVTSIVKPALATNISSIPANFHDVIGRFTAIIRGLEASEEDHVRLKLACSALRGEMTSHPLIAGLALQCSRMVKREERGIFTMSGRRESCTERESALIADCGMQLAMASGNVRLAREFGLSAASCRISLEELHAASLPTPGLALLWPEIMKENFQLIDQRFPRQPGAPERAWDVIQVQAFCNRSSQHTHFSSDTMFINF